MFGVIHPASWLEFFRYITEQFDGILYPEHDSRNLAQILIPKIMAAQGKYDVHFHRDHVGAEVSEWDAEDEKLPEGTEPYYLRANTGPRWILGGVMSRPFITTKQSDGRFAISSIESSSRLEGSNPLSRKMSFPKTHHCLCLLEGVAEFSVEGYQPTKLTDGESIFISKGTKFSIKFASKFVRIWSFTSGDGVETLIQEAGKPLEGYVLPDSAEPVDDAAVNSLAEKLGAVL